MIALKRGVLIGMLVLISVAAVACVATLLLAGYGPGEATALLSALSLGYLLSLAFGAFHTMERGAWWLRIWAGVGLGGTIVNVVLTPLFFWWEERERYSGFSASGDYDFQLWVANLVWTSLAATSWMVLLPLVLTPRMKWAPRLVQLATTIGLTASLLCFLCLTWRPQYERDLERVFPASLILSGAGALAILTMTRFLAVKTPYPLTSVSQRIWMRCPRCLKEQDLPPGESRCCTCKLLFKIEVEEPRCGKCGYNLFGLTRPVCPECGNIFRAEEAV